MSGRETFLVTGWSIFLAALLLGPVLGLVGGGQVLSYDMVWVPNLALTDTALGFGTPLPRNVPSDAVVAVLDNLFGGSLLQLAVLFGSLVGAGLGAAALCRRCRPDGALIAPLTALTVTQWNPFVAERLLLGHWPVLLGCAALPWLLLFGARWREEQRLPWPVPVWLVVGSLSASAGLLTGLALVAVAGTRSVRRWLVLSGLLAAVNAPWLIAGLLHADTARVTADAARVGAEVFAAHPEGLLPVPVATLTLGGIWNLDVVPGSRLGWFGWLSVALVLLALSFGGRQWWRAGPRRDAAAVLVLGLGAWAWAVASWSVPALSAFLAGNLPGGGLFRDGARGLGLLIPLIALSAGFAVERAVLGLRSRARTRDLAGPVSVLLLLLPVVCLPDIAWGAGALRVSHYPAAQLAAAERAGDSEETTLLLPFRSYRAPAFNDFRPVLDPTPRLIDSPVLSSDVLTVSGRVVPGEDPRAARAAVALTSPDPALRLRELGVGQVLVEPDVDRTTGAQVARLLTDPGVSEIRAAGTYRLLRIKGAVNAGSPNADSREGQVPMSLAWAGWLLAGVLGPLWLLVRGRRSSGTGVLHRSR